MLIAEENVIIFVVVPGAIHRGVIYRGLIYWGAILRGSIYWGGGGNSPGASYWRAILRGQFSGHEYFFKS